jgi:quinol-cytochrome oxidoreductase complex cytochrome b subunit
MSNTPDQDEKEKNRSAADWVTKPVYKILIVGLVLLELLGKEMDGGIKQTFHIILWIGLILIVIVNIINIITSFGSRKEKVEEDDSVGGD